LFAAAGEEDSAMLSPTRLANAIEALAEEYGCHLISVSAGDSSNRMPEVQHAMQTARAAGSLCIFAAGNLGGAPLYPALYDECLAVAACGRRQLAPAGTVHLGVEKTGEAVEGQPDIFLWRASARGRGVDLLCAGVGTFWCLEGKTARATCGTSYAAPVAAGVAAILLSHNRPYLAAPRGDARCRLALQILSGACVPVGEGVAALGLPVAVPAPE
jgi:hypothetical protein